MPFEMTLNSPMQFIFFVAILTTTLTLAVINSRLIDRKRELSPKKENPRVKRALNHINWNLKMFALLINLHLFLALVVVIRIILSGFELTFPVLDFLLLLWMAGNLVVWIRLFLQYCYHSFFDPERKKD